MATNRIPVVRSELEKAFRKHYLVGQGDASPSHILLLFYAVECGLKSLYLRNKRLNSTEDITDQYLVKDGHNLMAWSKALKLPATYLSGYETPDFRLRRDGKHWPISKAHQAWRYGALIDCEDEKWLIEWLKNVCKQLKEDGM